MRKTKKLSAAKIAHLTKQGRYGDGDGLWLQVGPTGTKAWLLRYMIDGKAREMGLGPLSVFSLAEARERARAARQRLADGVDPISERDAERAARRAEDAKAVTFKDAAARYIKAHRAGWKNPKHADQWEATLSTYAFPHFGALSVAAIETGHILKAIEPIWTLKPETASRTRGRIEAVLDWATARGYRKGVNPARWKGHLQNLLPAKTKVHKVQHQPALPYEQLPAFMADLRGMDSISARALEFTILTAARTGEAIGAEWSEIDLDKRVWTVPASRMKAGREHRSPLSDRAIEILLGLPRMDDARFVFPGGQAKRPLSNMAMLQLLRGMKGCDGLTVHGFRSTFRDWCGERTNFPREIAEAALAHANADKVESAYRRGDALEKRRRLMDAWAKFANETPREGKVVAMQRRPA